MAGPVGARPRHPGALGPGCFLSEGIPILRRIKVDTGHPAGERNEAGLGTQRSYKALAAAVAGKLGKAGDQAGVEKDWMTGLACFCCAAPDQLVRGIRPRCRDCPHLYCANLSQITKDQQESSTLRQPRHRAQRR